MTMPDELRGQYRPWDDKSTTVPRADLEALREAVKANSETVAAWAERIIRQRRSMIEAWLIEQHADPERDELLYVSDVPGNPPSVVHLVPQNEVAALYGTTHDERAARYPTLILSTVDSLIRP